MDLPHPEGPMIAVTARRSMAKVRFFERLTGPVEEAEVPHVHRWGSSGTEWGHRLARGQRYLRCSDEGPGSHGSAHPNLPVM